ncbi:MAG TPA: thioredoxin domain-containing protein [Actinocrinis sp.]|jgi:protein-disulfide isomerase|uniref:DsbA family protein n=1 Tax=Actinocrinis sp. TaxID=1920516 RepID=UPI002DDCE651|nr:thioredoxin domain-containing protein [Actinocrinis sp.]HEV3172990.1 thioredoxin domain-containing protein [Actinocrinis sp.]
MTANHDRKPGAQRRAEQLRAAQQAKTRRKRLMVIYGSVLGVIAVAVVIALIVANASAPKTPTAVPAGTVADTTGGLAAADAMAVPLGQANAPVQLTVYEDFRCSVCGQFEATYQAAYKPLIASGTLRLLIHPVNLIDNNLSGTSGSVHAGNAAGCAQDAGKFEAYHDVLYANQPAESDDLFASDQTLIAFAKQVPGLDTPTFESCVTSGRYDAWVRKNFADLTQVTNNQPGTPTFFANGKPFTLPSGSTAAAAQAAFTAAIDKLAGTTPPAAQSSTAGSASTSATP